MSSFQGAGLEEFALYRGVLISVCWNRGVPLYAEVSSFQGVGLAVFRGVLISSGRWNRGVPLYSRVGRISGGYCALIV